MSNFVESRRSALKIIATSLAAVPLITFGNGFTDNDGKLEKLVAKPYEFPFGGGVLRYNPDGSVAYEGPMSVYEKVLIHGGNPTWPVLVGGEHAETLAENGDPSTYYVPNGIIMIAYKPNDSVNPRIGDSAEHQLNASQIPPVEWFMVNGYPDGKTVNIKGLNMLLYGGQFIFPSGYIAAPNHPDAEYRSPYPEDVLTQVFCNERGASTFIPKYYTPRKDTINIEQYAVE